MLAPGRRACLVCDQFGHGLGGERSQRLAREQAARAEARAAQQRLSFLAEATNVLAASLDYEATLTILARLAVPYFADWCGIDMVEADGSIRQLAVAHVDPTKVEGARELRHRHSGASAHLAQSS